MRQHHPHNTLSKVSPYNDNKTAQPWYHRRPRVCPPAKDQCGWSDVNDVNNTREIANLWVSDLQTWLVMFERSHDHRGEKESEPKEEVNDGWRTARLWVFTPAGCAADRGHRRGDRCPLTRTSLSQKTAVHRPQYPCGYDCALVVYLNQIMYFYSRPYMTLDHKTSHK